MPINLPNLDDRTYSDLMEEALAMIPVHAPEWTNHNPSDPGITLIELLAYLAEMMIYRLNRVTDDQVKTFLRLLNADWKPTEGKPLDEEIRDVILLDDFGLAAPTEEQRRDLLEILEDRYERHSTMVTSQYPVEHWHDLIGDPSDHEHVADEDDHRSHHGQTIRGSPTVQCCEKLRANLIMKGTDHAGGNARNGDDSQHY